MSSVGVVRCSLKWGNLRNPYSMFQVSWKTAVDNTEEGEDDAKSACPSDVLGCTRDTMVRTMSCEEEIRS